MISTWKLMSLREVNVSLIDCDHRTPPASEHGYPYIAIPQIKNGHIDLSGVRYITREHFVEWTRKAKPQHYDVILSRRCNPGETALVPADLECALGQNLVLLRSDGTKLFPPYLRWLVRSPAWWEQVGKFINVGAVFESLRCADIPNFQLPIPPLPEQKAIARVLGSLDDKIELNRRTNTTLEALAQTLFRAWFVDFEPVKAKAAGLTPVGMDAQTAALFPSEFEESALGLIPKEWEVGTLAQVCESRRETVQPSSVHADSVYVGLEHIPQNSIALDNWGHAAQVDSTKSRFQRGDILFGKLRPYFHKVVIAPTDGICSTDILVLRSLHQSNFGFVLCHASSAELIEYATRLSNGARMPRVGWKDIASYSVVMPPSEIQERFTRLVQDMVSRINSNILESQTLAQLRDALLPRLISGRLRLPEAMREVEAKI